MPETEIEDTFLRATSLKSLDPNALKAVKWDRVETTVNSAGVEETTGFDDINGLTASLGRKDAEEPPELDLFTVEEDGVVYDMERREDGSEWLLGQSGQGRRGAAIQTKAPPPEGEREEGDGAGRGETEAGVDFSLADPGADPEAEGAAFTEGVQKTGVAAIDGVVQFIDALTDTVGLTGVQDFVEEVTSFATIDYELPEGEGYEIISDLTQTAAGMLPAAKILKGMGMASSFLRWTAAGFAADFAGFDPDEPFVGELAASIGKLEQPQAEAVRALLQEALEKDIDDGEFIKRIKNASGGALIGAVADSAFAMVRGGRALLKNPELRETVQRFIADESGMVSFHGGPNKWMPEPDFPQGRPRLDKIGTGEGVQAYGWGFYSAEAKGVATTYQKIGSKMIMDGRAPDWDDPHDVAAAWLHNHGGDRQAVIKQFEKSDWHSAKEVVELMKRGDDLPEVERLGGQLYELDIPDEELAKYLDWDLPFGGQPESVQTALAEISVGVNKQDVMGVVLKRAFNNKMFAADLVKKGIGEATPQELAEGLREAGIPGLKYLDQGSRQTSASPAAEGTATRLLDAVGGDVERAIALAKKRISEGNIPEDERVPGGLLDAIDFLEKQGDTRTRNYVTWDQDVLDRSSIITEDGESIPLFSAGAGIAGLAAGEGGAGDDEIQVAGLFDRLLKPLLRGAGDAATALPKVKPKIDSGAEQAILDTYREYKSGPLEGQRVIGDAGEGLDFNFNRMETYDEALTTINTVSEVYAKEISDNGFGVVPHKITRQVADLLGADEDTAYAAIKSLPGDVKGLHVRALAMRDMLVQAAEEVDRQAYDLAKRPTLVTDEELLAYQESVAKLTAMHMNAKGVQTEIARALSAYRIPAETPDLARAEMVMEALQSAGGRDKIKQLADLWIVTPVEKKARLAKDNLIAKSVASLRELWINGLLSGLRTHEINFVSNTLFGGWQIVDRATAAAIGSVRRAGQFASIGDASDRVYWGELPSQLFGFIESVPDAYRLAWGTLKTGEPASALSKIEHYRFKATSAQAWGLDEASMLGRFVDIVGTGVRLPGRALITMDEFNKGIARQMERRALAYREAQTMLSRGGSQEQAIKRYDDILNRDVPEIEAQVSAYADMATFTKPLGEHGRRFSEYVDKAPLAWLIFPFKRTPINIVKETLQRTPAAYWMFKEVRAEFAAGGARRDLALSKIANGSALMGWGMYLSGQGFITGGGPSDPRMNATWRKKHQPYSINFRAILGDDAWKEGGYESEWVPYGRLAPIGDIIGIAADMAEYRKWAPRDMADESEATLFTLAVGATLDRFKDKTFFQGISDFSRAFDDPKRFLERYIAKAGGSFVPASSMVRDIESAFDPARTDTSPDPYETNPIIAQIERTLNELRARTPGMNDDMPDRLNHWGEVVLAYEGSWYQAFNAFAPRKNKAQPIDEALIVLRYPLTMPRREISGVKLDAQRYHDLIVAMNEIKMPTGDGTERLNMRDHMSKLVQSTMYKALITDDLRIKAIKSIREDYLDLAKGMMSTPQGAGSKYFDSELMGWVIRAKIGKPLGQEFAP